MRSNDELLKIRHYKNELATAFRRKREPKLPLGPGHVIKGSMFDCNRKVFEKALTDYWDRLFVGWNPYKLDGKGCWEVWQKPIAKQELNDFEHWVADLEYLSLEFIKKLESMDAWKHKSMVSDIDEAHENYEAELDRKETELIKYTVKHNKSLFGKLKGLAQDGYNPLWFLSDNKEGSGQA
ncbi:MAG: hypothetical protein NVS1B10_06460 [Candidatus Saccharimonadales bacterium]